MRNIDLVVFDMAGTTIMDSGQVAGAFTAALHEYRITLGEGALRPWRGAPKRAVLRYFIEQHFGPDHPDNAERIERAYARFREQLESAFVSEGVRAIGGTEDAFDWLRARGVKIALTTGFYRQVTDIILRAVGWDKGAIDASICSDDVARGRPAPYMIFHAMEATGTVDVQRVVKVGDTVLDLLAGTNAGARGVVGVLSGSQDIGQLGKAPHTHIISSVAEFPALYERAFGYVGER